MHPDATSAAKSSLRRAVLARRAAVPTPVRRQLDADLEGLVVGLVSPGSAVAAFVPDGGEAGGATLPGALADAGARVWLPVSPPHGPLLWALFAGADDLRPGRFGIPVPSAGPVAPSALPPLDLVLVPAVAVDRSGARLGRGGGYYDQSLAGIPGSPLRVAVLDDEDVLDSVPCEDHDLRVDGVATPTGLLRFRTWHSAE